MMTGGVRVEVTLIGGQKLEFSVGARLQTQELVALVASHYALRDAHYFSLAFKNSSGHYQWLIENLRLLDHDFARGVKVLPLTFMVKYYPESATDLRDAQAVEIFYHHAKDIITKSTLFADKGVVCKLSAYSLHISHGDFLDKSTIKVLLKNTSLLPSRLKEDQLTLDYCLQNVYEHYCPLKGTTRGEAILKYMREVESVPGYGVHYYGVKDRCNLRFFLGISRTGIAEYEPEDRLEPRNEFYWQQLENLYIREKKFSIEVHDPNRAWGTPEWPISSSGSHLDTISEDISGLSTSRRPFWTGNVRVFAWFCETQQLCKDVWSMAIAQHQFYLERKTIKGRDGIKDSFDLAGELSRSYLSLSAQSSPSISRSGSHSSIHQNSLADDTASTESLAAARMELVAALQQRQDALRQKLNEKTKELKMICLKEGELTGELPAEYPLNPGEPPPVVRKRVGTSFTIEESLLGKLLNKQDETISGLELEYEIQTKIATAALKLANESSLRKRFRRQRKQSYQQALTKLKEIERKLKLAKSRHMQTSNNSTMPKMKKKPRPFSESEGGQEDNCVGRGIVSTRNCDYTDTSMLNTSQASVGSVRPPHKPMPHQINHKDEYNRISQSMQSAPPSPLVGSSDSSSSQNAFSDGSRSSSPGRPVSGYIPSGVYTRSQYRAQHYPTLSTRGQSVPLELAPHDQSFTRAVFNIPQQRGSIVSHSLDDLDASVNTSTHITANSPYSHANSFAVTPHQYKFHHHHYDHHSRRPVIDSQERYGSLDRRRSGSGRYESRSMERLNDGNTPQGGVPQPVYPTTPALNSSYSYKLGPTEAETYPENAYSNGYGEADTPTDVTDSATQRRSSSHSRQLYTHKATTLPVDTAPDTSLNTVHRIVRTASGRSYVETSFTGDIIPSPNQENIPPEVQAHRTPVSSLKPEFKPCLRATASINAADHLRPYRVPVNELPPLRATKSTVDLPPLKRTNNERDNVSRLINVPLSQSSGVTHLAAARSYGDEQLVSLAEAARAKKDCRNWPNESMDGKYDQSKYLSRTPRSLSEGLSKELPDFKLSVPPQTIHNISGSSVGSSSSSSAGSVFPPASDPVNFSLNATLTVESPNNHMIINAGTFQPSREISKPFQMSDFYKYSTKYRRQSSGHLGSDRSSPLPTVPPKDALKPPPSPSIVARHSSPAPQQKGIYHPPALMTCQPVVAILDNGNQDTTTHCNSNPQQIIPNSGSTHWENGQVHQAVPATVTNKRAATLV